MSHTDLYFTFDVSHNSTSKKGSSAIEFEVVEFTLTESLNEPFVLKVELLSKDPAVDFSQVLDQGAVLSIWNSKHKGAKPLRQVHGLVSHLSQGDTGFRRTRYHAVVEPELSRTRLSADWKIYQQTPVQEILASTLKSQRLTNHHISIAEEHLSREYCVQAGLTHFEFIQRLASEEGLVYTFEHQADGHRLLMVDAIQSLGAMNTNLDGSVPTSKGQGAPQVDPVLYNPNPAGEKAQASLNSFSYQENVRTSSQTQRDYTFKNPKYSQEHNNVGQSSNKLANASNPRHQEEGAQSSPPVGHYEHYTYPGRYKLDASGKPFTHTKIQSLRNDTQLAVATGDDARIQPGFAFALTGHPRSSLNIYWRPVKVTHTGTQHGAAEEESAQAQSGTHYSQTAELIPANANWKAAIPQTPFIKGPLIGHVAGPAGEEIYTDEYGRVKVQFPWDRGSGNSEHSSCWIRVAQNWAGASWGHIAIPRIGQEVIVDFLNGDEDQPIIIGRTYDATHPVPYKLPALKAQSTTKSKEHKGSGYNELLLDDTTGEIKTQLHSTHASTQLTMGHLTHPRKADGSGERRGDGFELRSDSWGAIRAGRGLYVSANQREKAEGNQLDLQEAIAQLQNALDLAQSLADSVQPAGGNAPDTADQEHQLSQVYENLQKAGILLSAPEGIALVTPKSLQASAQVNSSITSGASTDISAGKDARIAAANNVSLYAAQNDMSIIAGKGKVKVHANDNEMELMASKGLKVVSTQNKVEVSAEKELLLTSGGAYIRIKDGHIEIHAPGIIEHKGAAFPYLGPTTLNSSYDLPPTSYDPANPKPPQGAFVLSSHPEGQGRLYRGEPYKLYKDGALIQEGLTDEKAAFTYDYEPKAKYRVEILSGHSFNIEDMPPTKDKDEILARSLGQMGYGSANSNEKEGEAAAGKTSSKVVEQYFQRSVKADKD